jgi:hypothetical protein
MGDNICDRPANFYTFACLTTMGYIRSNEDYYESLGFSPLEAKVQAEMDKRGVDYGVCNPIKAKLAAEEEAEIRNELKDDRC